MPKQKMRIYGYILEDLLKIYQQLEALDKKTEVVHALRVKLSFGDGDEDSGEFIWEEDNWVFYPGKSFLV